MALALLQFIPLSFAAITPTMVIFVTILLAADGAAKRAVAVIAGRYLGLIIFGFASLFALHRIPASPVSGRLDQRDIPVIFLVSGIGLMLAAAYTMLFGQVPTEENQQGLFDRFRRLNARVLFIACLATVFISVRQLSLLVAGTAIIRESETDFPQEMILLAVLCLMMIWPLLIPLVVRYGMGDRGHSMLERLRIWMGQHQRSINALVLAFFGGILVVKGIAGI